MSGPYDMWMILFCYMRTKIMSSENNVGTKPKFDQNFGVPKPLLLKIIRTV